jgi:hypothetical protein
MCEAEAKLINEGHRQETRFRGRASAKAKIRVLRHFAEKQRNQCGVPGLTNSDT